MLQNESSPMMETPLRPRPISFTNGALKRHSIITTTTTTKPILYKECLRNHAASLGGHALDGCCEFMPSPLYSPSDPSSLKCAACGCHRNFHRRDNDQVVEEDDDDPRPQNPNPVSPSQPLTLSAPHMLLALSAGGHSAPTHDETNGGSGITAVVRKRFRTKFSREQKEKMQEVSDRLGWKMRKQDEGLVEELCREIGVGKDVFKVWMHNNKNTLMKRSGDNQGQGENVNLRTTDGDGVVVMGMGMATSDDDNNNNNNNNCNGISSNTHLMNGSSSSS